MSLHNWAKGIQRWAEETHKNYSDTINKLNEVIRVIQLNFDEMEKRLQALEKPLEDPRKAGVEFTLAYFSEVYKWPHAVEKITEVAKLAGILK